MENKNLLDEALATQAKELQVSIVKEASDDAKTKIEMSGDPVALMAALTEAMHKVMFGVADEKGVKSADALGAATAKAVVVLFPMAYMSHKLETRAECKEKAIDDLLASTRLLNNFFKED